MKKSILIPNPFTEDDRIRELFLISNQYRNRVVPEKFQAPFDEGFEEGLTGMREPFDVLLQSHGIKGESSNIIRLKKAIVPSILAHKYHFNVERPYALARKYNIPFKYDRLRTTHSPSYPSGHTTQAYYVAEKLSKKYPNLRNQLLALAELISESRIDRGVHYPSDLIGGRLLVRAILRGEQ